MYDMLKQIDKSVVISNIQLEKKSGGKSGIKKNYAGLKCGVIVCSDTVSKGENEDTTGKAIIEKLKNFGIEIITYKVIPDEMEQIQTEAKNLSNEKHNLLIFSGGTGLSPRDVTPDALEPLIEHTIPGLMETARRYGQDRMPYAMLSRGVAGFIGSTLVITTPGSSKGAIETIDALFPQVLHVFEVRNGMRH
jgi:molybdenum cofactor synthesis domain-containing protein